MHIILSLYLRPIIYSQHCLRTTNLLPCELLSIQSCYLENQWTSTQFSHARKPDLDLLDTVSPAWSASTFALIVKPSPHEAGMLSGSISSPSMCPYPLHVQSFFSNHVSSMIGSLGSNTGLVLWNLSKYKKIWKTC